MSRTVLDESDEVPVRGNAEAEQGRIRAGRADTLENVTNAVNDLEVRAFAIASERVALAGLARLDRTNDAGAMIVHVDPVTDIGTVAIDRQRLALECVENHEGNQFFRKLVGAVVVRAVRRQRREPVGLVVGANEHVCAGLRGRVGRIWRVRRFLVE
jgi:hypothetical protein